MCVDLGPSVSSNELNDKYKDLLAKINRHARLDDGNGVDWDEGEDGIDEAGRPIGDDRDDNSAANGNNDKLKKLYDASVAFKNDLANLRGSIKSLNSRTTAYSNKVDSFQGELDSLFEMNKRLQEERKREGPKSASVRMDLDHKHKQMKEMQHAFVNMISVQ